ncbi:MAG: GntR family transcriptional regulator [Clostridiales bacterium]|nr:GntR family transcriptional regulator [Clostridiales bacterium]
MQWELNTDKPVYLQLVEQIQAEIISGSYKPGDKLPSVRDLAAQATVNPNTMQRAMTELEREGLVYTNRTAGRFITSDEDLIKQLKKQYITSVIQEFLDRMKQLGLELDEIIHYLNIVSDNNSVIRR